MKHFIFQMPRLLRAPCTSKIIKVQFFKRETFLKRLIADLEINEITKKTTDSGNIKNVFKNFMASYLFHESVIPIRYWENMTVLNRQISYNLCNSMFLGRIVNLDISKQLIYVSSGLNNNGLFKLPKKSFNSFYSTLKSPTLDGVRFYLPFINNPNKNTTSDCFLRADMYEFDDFRTNWRPKANVYSSLINSSRFKIKLLGKKKKFKKFNFLKKKHAPTRCNFIL